MTKEELELLLAEIVKLSDGMEPLSANSRSLRQKQIDEHRDRIRDAYAAHRGWQRVSRFSLSDLSPVTYPDEDWPIEFTDHFSYWAVGGDPVALTAHLYSFGEQRRIAASAWAASHGLQARFPTDFSSWWLPGRTTLIEFRRMTS